MEINVKTPEKTYPIKIGFDNLYLLEELLEGASKAIIVTDENVYGLYYKKVEEIFYKIKEKKGLEFRWKVLTGGEETKNLKNASELYDEACDFQMDRDSFFVAFGGGVIGDLCGFVASTYMRGTRFLQLPTTLLAQVDSSVGGKVAINHPMQKNLIGSFYHPEAVLMDLNFLLTLPEREFNAGLAEVVKSAILRDRDYFYFVKDYLDKFSSLESKKSKQDLVKIIGRACEIKAEIVKQDEKDHGIRQLLNLGHTFGHALEGMTGYSYFKHGEAVMWGIIFASRLSFEQGILSENDKNEIYEIINELNPPPLPEKFVPQDMERYFATDKKRRGSVIPFILPLEIGKAEIFKEIAISDAISVVDD
ncbi:3-dehydroquinate synthase [Natranaerofaba carboxydovora]|uniref:3-dehydroquinate synthase n=1 Tax=Natranaerofaba carboxydovora TaxID=2742683 RepID=UPI001F143DEF|nr:3-dehydroquinate synthase [Natranaerofaba carboxydovora]UMZ73238.1 3-dehydroquinate synthase [Natranaerofaba carboxydovora]